MLLDGELSVSVASVHVSHFENSLTYKLIFIDGF